MCMIKVLLQQQCEGMNDLCMVCPCIEHNYKQKHKTLTKTGTEVSQTLSFSKAVQTVFVKFRSMCRIDCELIKL